MKNHEYYEDLVNLKVDDMLTAGQEDELAKHLTVCPECRDRLDLYMMVRKMSDDLLVDPPENFASDVMHKVGLEKSGKSLKKKFLPHIFTVAGAAAAVALLIYSGAFKLGSTSAPNNASIAAPDSESDKLTAASAEAGSGNDNGAVAMDTVEPEAAPIPQPTFAPEEPRLKSDEGSRSGSYGLIGMAPDAKNKFDVSTAEVGDFVAGFEIVEIDSGNSNNGENLRIVFAGEATLTGTLYFDNNEYAKWGKFIYFRADEESASLLPLPSDDTGEVWIGIDNYDETVKMLDIAPEDEGKTLTYDAVIVIKSYTISQDFPEGYNFATLENIVSLNRISE